MILLLRSRKRYLVIEEEERVGDLMINKWPRRREKESKEIKGHSSPPTDFLILEKEQRGRGYCLVAPEAEVLFDDLLREVHQGRIADSVAVPTAPKDKF